MRTALLVGTLALAACGSEEVSGQPAGVDPGARSEHAMVYDAARRQVVLFGGAAADASKAAATYTYDGTAWRQAATSGPSPRQMPMMAYDAARGVVVLHGGLQRTSSGMTQLTDTWEWNGSSWTQRSTGGPGARAHAGMGYDAAGSRVLLYGGFGAGDAILRDTWAWNGTTWQKVHDDGPAGRSVNAMVEVGGSLMLATVYNAPDTPRDGNMGLELWRWSGSGWTATEPRGVRFSPAAAMAPTGQDGAILLYAGWDAPPAAVATSWIIEPGGARSLGAAAAGRRRGAAAAFDANRSRVVLYGGENDSSLLGDTWELNGSSWQRVQP